MNEILRPNEKITIEELLIFAEEARLWEEASREDEERNLENGTL